MRAFYDRFAGTAYGGDYNPEQWPREAWDEDVRLMAEAGVKLVTVNVFGWGLLEPEEGCYDFGWLDEVMEHLDRHGVAVDLATGTASPPAWMAARYPDSRPVSETGVRAAFGGRAQFSPSSPVYRRAAGRLVEQLASRYSGHPALAMWHVGNEFSGVSYDEGSAQAFRSWLARRYGTVEALNEAWGTRVWAQHYTSFEHVPAPGVAPSELRNPTHRLDFTRFTSDALLDCYRAEVEILRRHTPDTPVTTNFMASYKPLDYWAWSEVGDVVSLDSYPDPADLEAVVEAAFAYDLARSLGGEPWLLMEHAVGAVSWREVNVPRPPGQMRVGSLQAVARGAAAVLAFQWRGTRHGAEKWHSSLLPHAGTATRTWREVTGVGRELASLPATALGRVEARVALVLGYDSWWACEQGNLPRQPRYLEELLEVYRVLWARDIPVDIVAPGAPLQAYDVVVLTQLYLADDTAIDTWNEFVNSGGHLVATFCTALVDETDTLRGPGYAPELADLAGLRISEIAPQREGAVLVVECPACDQTHTASTWLDVVEPAGAAVLARIVDGPHAGDPVALRRTVGFGAITYLTTKLDATGLGHLLVQVCDAAGVHVPPPTPQGVETVSRRSPSGLETVFVLNHADAVASVRLRPGGRDLLTGRPLGTELELAGHDCVAVRYPPAITDEGPRR